MKTKYLLFVLPLVALCACNKAGVESNDYKVATITAVCPTSNDNTTTKTTFWEKEGVYTLLWWHNDKVKVQKAPMELSEPATENRYIPTGYTFSAPGLENYATTATFVTDNPLPYDIEDGETYAVSYGGIENESTGVVYIVPNGTTNILNRRLQTYIRNTQTRGWNANSRGNNLGMALSVIPMFALIKEGVPGHSASNLTFSTVASIIKLNLTNNTGSSQTITSIRLTNNKSGYTEDVCGFYGMEFNPETLEITYPEENWITVHHEYDGITLNCIYNGNPTSLENGETQVFTFVVFGGVNHGTLTWKVMNGDTQIGSDITVTPGVLDPCKVYTKNASLN